MEAAASTSLGVAQRRGGGPLVRAVAALALGATVLGRAVGPALRGAREGIDRIIVVAGLVGDVLSQLYALVGIGLTIVLIWSISRERRLGVASRALATVVGALSLATMGPALHDPLPERAGIALGAGSGVLALVAAFEGLRVARTRALAAVVGATGLAALLHLSAVLLAVWAGERAHVRFATLARALGSGSVAFDALAVAVALVWLATRGGRPTSLPVVAALAAAVTLASGAAQGAADGAAAWQIVAFRSLQHLVGFPLPVVRVHVRWMLEALAPALALVALLTRGQIAAVAGALALALVARPATDVPLAALSLGLAALATMYAAHDERGMWDALLERPGPDGRPGGASQP